MLRFVHGKPLGDISTEILNGPQEHVLETPSPVREPEQPLPEVNLVDPVVATLDDEEFVQHSPHQSPSPVEASTSSPTRNQFSPLPEIRPSFLSELFEDELDNTANLDIRYQIGQVLRNQQVIFSVLSKILGLVQGIGQPGRALSETGLTVGGESVQGGNQLGRALSGARLPFGEESVQGGNQEEDILGNGQGGIHERELEPFASPQGSSSLLPGRALSETRLPFGGESVQGRNQLGRALSETMLPFGGESVQGRNQLGRALSETRLPFGEESVQGGNQEEDILGNGQGGIHERELEPFASPQGSSTLLPEEDTDVLDGVEDDIFYREIVKIKGQSCSMGNFATKLVQKFFHSSELENRNCMGSRGKVPLEPSKLERVKHYTFRMYPTPSTQKEQQWKKCIIAIDETLRRKKK